MRKHFSAVRRRDFLKAASAAVAAPYVITTSALGDDKRPAASERIVMAGIGLGNMGSGDQGVFLGRGDVQYVAACDVRGNHRNAAKDRADKRYNNSDCKTYNDFRELLARDDIDAVHIATPDHWHSIIAIEACRAGKDVYCQKPETRTLREGPLMVGAARRYSRVFSGGSQRVLQDYRGAVNACWDGSLGTIKSVNVILGPPSWECNLPAEQVPSDFDWNLWLGPAPWAPYNGKRCSGSYSIDGSSWRSFEDYSGGGMTDWGAHHFGGALFAVGLRELQPTEVVYNDDKDGKYLTYHFPNGTLVYCNKPNTGQIQVEGTPGEKIPPKTVPSYKGQGGIYGDFIDCVKTREKPFRDIEFASHTAAVCHLGLIAYELKRSLKWDEAKQEFPGDEEANRLALRPMRQPWRI